MSYFYNNKIYDEYVIDGVINAADGDILKDDYFIEIFNNEEMRINMTQLDFRCSDYTVDTSQLSKIHIDWGDGTIDRLSKSIINRSSTIGTYNPISWKLAKHTFNVDKRMQYRTDDVRVLPKITITLFNTFNDRIKIYIPYKIVYKTLYDIGSKFTLMGANVNNTNRTSYVLKQNSNDNVLIVSVNDWKKMYGNQNEKVYIIDDAVSMDFSDEFVNEDSIVWDWAAVPEVNMTVKHVVDIHDISYFHCSFQEVTVNIDTWKPYCFRLDDSGDREYIVSDVDEEKMKFSVYQYNNLQRQDLDTGVYKIYLGVTGINDVVGESQNVYMSVPSVDYTPPARIQKHTTNFTSGTKDSSKTFYFKLGNLATGYDYKIQKKMLTSAKLTLRPIEVKIDGKKQQADSAIIFTYDLLDGSVLENEQNSLYSYTFRTKDIPDGKYEVSIVSSDVLGHTQEQIYDLNKPLGQKNRSGEYPFIKQFNINYTDFGNITMSSINEDQKKVTFNWTIDNYIELDTVRFTVSSFDKNGDEHFLYNIQDSFEKFDHQEVNSTKTNFTFTDSLQNVPDGDYNVNVSHMLNMDLFGGSRKRDAVTKVWKFKYPRPHVTVDNLYPFIQINRASSKLFIPSIRISCTSDKTFDGLSLNWTNVKNRKGRYADGLMSQTISMDTFDEGLYSLLDTQNYRVQFDYRAFDANDTTYKRTEERGQVSAIIRCTNEKLDSLLEVVDTPDNIFSSAYKFQILDKPIDQIDVTNKETYWDTEKKTYTPAGVLADTVVDVNRKNRFLSSDGKYYYYNDTSDFFAIQKGTGNVVKKPLGFGVRTYVRDDGQLYKRFYSSPEQLTVVKSQALGSPISVLAAGKIQITKGYDGSSNTGTLHIQKTADDSPLFEEDYSDIIHARFRVYNITDMINPVYQGDFRKGLNHTISGLPLGFYITQFEYDSFDTFKTSQKYICSYESSSQVNQVQKDLKLYAQPDETVSEIKTNITTLSEGYALVLFRWTLYFKEAKNVQLHVKNGSRSYSYNVDGYETYTPPAQFTTSSPLYCWLTFDGEPINWKINSSTSSRAVRYTKVWG